MFAQRIGRPPSAASPILRGLSDDKHLIRTRRGCARARGAVADRAARLLYIPYPDFAFERLVVAQRFLGQLGRDHAAPTGTRRCA